MKLESSGARIDHDFTVLDRTVVLSDNKLVDEINSLNTLWGSFSELRRAPLPGDYTWPNDRIRLPSGERPENDKEGMAIHDIVALTMAFCFLHEVQHLRFAADDNRPAEPMEEELQCDVFATSYLLDRVSEYHAQTKEPVDKVASKRAMGIGVALGAVLAMTQDLNSQSGTHPPSTSRLCGLIVADAGNPNADCWLTLFTMLLSMAFAWNVGFMPLAAKSYRCLCNELLGQFPSS